VDEEDIEELIEEKVEEKLADRNRSSETEDKVSRRSFLKMMGLGAGGLALASPAASWFSVNDNVGSGGGGKQTLSGVLSEGNDIDGQGQALLKGASTVHDEWLFLNSCIPWRLNS